MIVAAASDTRCSACCKTFCAVSSSATRLAEAALAAATADAASTHKAFRCDTGQIGCMLINLHDECRLILGPDPTQSRREHAHPRRSELRHEQSLVYRNARRPQRPCCGPALGICIVAEMSAYSWISIIVAGVIRDGSSTEQGGVQSPAHGRIWSYACTPISFRFASRCSFPLQPELRPLLPSPARI